MGWEGHLLRQGTKVTTGLSWATRIEGYTVLVLTMTVTIFAGGIRTRDKCFAVNRSLPAKVQVWIPAMHNITMVTLECWEIA